MDKNLRDMIRANRLDVFRHTLRSIALASAAASGVGLAGVSGCADAHMIFADQGPVADQGPPFVPLCSTEVNAVDLSSLALPEGMDGLIALTLGFEWSTTVYIAGDFCDPDPNAGGCGWEGLELNGGVFALYARRDGMVSPVTLEEVVTLPVASPEAAALVALSTGYHLLCPGRVFGPGSVTRVSGGYEVVAFRWTCDEVYEGTLRVDDEGEVRVVSERVISSFSCAVIGRLTDGYDAPARPCDGPVLGRYFAQVAGLEGVAVHAFERMASELCALGAPAELVALARASADDERRHVHAMGALATRFGATPAAHEQPRFELRGLYEVALENAVEGCVRETYGAVVGHHQAVHAADPAVRAALAQVADDETRHAALSWALAAWAEPQLGETERAAVEAARREAIEALRVEVARPEPEALVRDAGLPSVQVARAMMDALGQQVWA